MDETASTLYFFHTFLHFFPQERGCAIPCCTPVSAGFFKHSGKQGGKLPIEQLFSAIP
jgi:hypothetical protein